MIADHWKRIAGIHVQDDATLGTVWLAHDNETDVVHLYDCSVFKIEVLAVIAEGLIARGRWIPVAWEPAAEEIAKKLIERGCNMLPEPVKDTPALAEVASREILARMQTGRFKVEERLADWLDEYRNFYREEAKVPRASYPLMSATRHAVAQLEFARRLRPKGKRPLNYPKVTIL